MYQRRLPHRITSNSKPALNATTIRTATFPPPVRWVSLAMAALMIAGCSDNPMSTGIDARDPAAPAAAFATIGTSPLITSTVVASGPGDQTDPRISGSIVSYTRDDNGAITIRYHNLATGTDQGIPNIGEVDFLSDISGTKIVFDRINDDYSVYVYDIATGGAPVEVASQDDAMRHAPAIGGNTVAWQDFAYGTAANAPEIAVNELGTATRTRLTDDALLDREVRVSPDGNLVVWVKCTTSGTACDVWKAIKSAGGWTTSAVTGATGEESRPDSDGGIIVYASSRPVGGTAEQDIYWQPVSGGVEQRLELPGDQRNPNVSNGLITFESIAEGGVIAGNKWDLWAYDAVTDVAYPITETPTISEILNDVSVSPDGVVRIAYVVVDGNADVHALSFQRAPAAEHYDFTGFFQPVDNNPAVNKAKAGSAIPVKFSLGGDQGLDIFAAGYPLTRAGTCDQTAGDVIEETVTAGGSSLSYDLVTAQYTYVWKTNKAWAGTCRQLVVGLNDGTTHTAWFNFVK
jgi:hypothetical protein